MRWPSILLLALTGAAQVGCTSLATRDYPPLAEVQYERGEPCDLVDIPANVLSIPSKILMWNRKVDNHCISMETERAVENYMVSNGLDTTKVRFNQYDPLGEWKRLGRNTAIPPLLRYTVGTAKTLGYTLCPGRLFGGDNYNPYTDTLSMYSDVPAVGMAEVAYAKNLRSRRHRGWYTFGQEFPIIGMHHEGKATEDVLNYLAVSGDPHLHREGYQVLYPRYGAAWGTSLGDIVGGDINPAGTIAGGIIGHIAGRKRSNEIAAVSYEAPVALPQMPRSPATYPSEPTYGYPMNSSAPGYPNTGYPTIRGQGDLGSKERAESSNTVAARRFSENVR